jgi:hypothetical protein
MQWRVGNGMDVPEFRSQEKVAIDWPFALLVDRCLELPPTIRRGVGIITNSDGYIL